MPRRRQQGGLRVVRKERFDLICAFSPEHRAGAVQQSATRFQQGPQRFKQPGLNERQLGNIRFTAQPANIRVATHDARGRAGRIEQNCIEQLTIPPSRGVGCISDHNLRLQVQALQGLMNFFTAGGIHIQRGDLAVRYLQQMSRFATGRGAGIQNAQRAV